MLLLYLTYEELKPDLPFQPQTPALLYLTYEELKRIILFTYKSVIVLSVVPYL